VTKKKMKETGGVKKRKWSGGTTSHVKKEKQEKSPSCPTRQGVQTKN